MRHTHHFVDELFNRDDTPLGRQIPISNLEVNPDQPRESVGNISDLALSIKKHGILEPLLVRRLEKGRYSIIAGERRYHAAMEAGLTQIPCIEVDILKEAETLEIALVENLQRKDLDPFEEAQGYTLLKDKYGYTQEEIASAALFLASPEADFINGHSLNVDGGYGTTGIIFDLGQEPRS